MSPTVFRHKNYRFFFFSREEKRMHVHVSCPEGEAKFWLEPIVALNHNYGLRPRKLKELEKIMLSTATMSSSEIVEVSDHVYDYLTKNNLQVTGGIEPYIDQEDDNLKSICLNFTVKGIDNKKCLELSKEIITNIAEKNKDLLKHLQIKIMPE